MWPDRRDHGEGHVAPAFTARGEPCPQMPTPAAASLLLARPPPTLKPQRHPRPSRSVQARPPRLPSLWLPHGGLASLHAAVRTSQSIFLHGNPSLQPLKLPLPPCPLSESHPLGVPPPGWRPLPPGRTLAHPRELTSCSAICLRSGDLISSLTFLLHFLFLNEMQLTYNIRLVSGAQHRDWTSLYVTQCSPRPVWSPSVAMQRYCDVIDHVPYAVLLGSALYRSRDHGGNPQ